MMLAALPAGWREVTIEEIQSELGSGITPRGGESSYLPRGIPLIRSQNVLMNELCRKDVAHISPETHQSMKRSAVAPGDVLLNITGASIGRVAWVPQDLSTANINQHVCRIRLKREAFAPFISLFLSSERGQGQIMGSQFGTTRQGLNYGQVRALKVPLPPLREQCAITEVLLAVQAAKQARHREAELERERKAALMQHLFTHGIRGEATKQTEIGEMPESWEVIAFADCVESLQYGTSEKCGNDSSGLPVLRIPNIIGGRIDTVDLKFARSLRNAGALQLLPGDLLFVRTNGVRENIGRCAMYRDHPAPALFASYLIRARLKSNLLLP